MRKPALLWLPSITCNGNTHSFLNHPELAALTERYEVVYHPALPSEMTLPEVLEGKARCDVLVLEGAFRERGMQKCGKEVLDVALAYAKKARLIVTAGTCATFGGIFAQYDPKHIAGFGFNKTEPLPRLAPLRHKLVSLPGCPIHPRWMGYVLEMAAAGREIARDSLCRPKELYGYTVHQGCLRNEYFEWKVDTHGFGTKEGCMFYELGCQGPYTRGSCNKILWHDVNSKTRAGTPCFGCTEPDFPKTALFKTKTHMGIPAAMPLGVPKRAYLTLTGVAKSFHIKRLSAKLTEYE